ncbi:MAG TPA: hypothetical protein VF272_01690 [Candidatus Saccharimonadia bacterium]
MSEQAGPGPEDNETGSFPQTPSELADKIRAAEATPATAANYADDLATLRFQRNQDEAEAARVNADEKRAAAGLPPLNAESATEDMPSENQEHREAA